MCGDRDGTEFPLRAELRDGPAEFPRGGYWRAWHLELRNTTRAACRAIHPVVVLADEHRALRPEHISFEFYDVEASRWRAVRFESTDEDENVGVFEGDGFPGFAVPPGRTVTVTLRSRFTRTAPIGEVTANVTTVQRRGDDGDWVGQSRDYTFGVTEGPGTEQRKERGEESESADADAGTGAAKDKVPEAPTDPRPPAATPGGDPLAGSPPALADTGRPDRRGRDALLPLAALSAACLLAGTALVTAARRLRR
ncbi:hypothetical protein [Streptomyces sp. XD-27]|uniref:hypothetical protein n=1 Tax=Streptomyces sp. XD-27 TaxID=3062779 RepID=UPI0026F44920|nr:hypothetical protein [Streptomyces sp. XD-27]WKX70563.1 hypothetical protein Q3Y56_12135 [Streptomyces sp. XD-27]